MSIQIAVRLPDDLVAQVDDLIAAGELTSRASIVEHALRKELRYRQYQAELEYWRNNPEDDESTAIAMAVQHAAALIPEWS